MTNFLHTVRIRVSLMLINDDNVRVNKDGKFKPGGLSGRCYSVNNISELSHKRLLRNNWWSFITFFFLNREINPQKKRTLHPLNVL